MSVEIESAIDADDWDEARRLIEVAIVDEPDNHWLITRLSLTYYEQFDYELSLQYAQAALEIAPLCPLATWDYGGSLDMLKRYDEAIPVFQRMISLGDDVVAFGDCGEGLDWARSLIADCHYRVAGCHRESGAIADAKAEYETYLKLRASGWGSIYDESEAQRHLREC